MENKSILSRGTGKRKSATAFAMMVGGSGNVIIERRRRDGAVERVGLDRYPIDVTYREKLVYPIQLLLNKGGHKELEKIDFILRMHGGGVSGQVGAGALSLARALFNYNSEKYAVDLKSEKQLTRDPRVVLPKMYGRKKNRKKRQYRKR